MVWGFFFQWWVVILFTDLLSDWAATVKTAARNRVDRFGNASYNIRLFAAPGWIGNWYRSK